MEDFEILTNLIDDYNKFVCLEINEIPAQHNTPSDPNMKELFEKIKSGAEAFKRKRNRENILFGQIGLGLFALQMGNFVRIEPYENDTSMVAETIGYFNNFVRAMSKTADEIHSISNAAQNGDFTLRADEGAWRGDVKELIEAINRLCAEINHMLAKSFEDGSTLAKFTDELKNARDSIGFAAIEQAAALERAAMYLKELTGAARGNLQHTANMAEVAIETRGAANESEKLARETMSAINEITEAMDEINGVIKIIENIASQTNILSLNAAIEATRAGAAGRGFAVVATEVRKLSGKSADAAKQIKELAVAANKKSNDGLKISNQMIQKLKELNAKITATTEIITNVSTSSNEQMAGISQINEAVAELDKTTQKNASIAKETDAIADDIADMSDNILREASSKKFVALEHRK